MPWLISLFCCSYSNLENNPLVCRCENKWIQDTGQNRVSESRNDRPWPRITPSSFPRLTCLDPTTHVLYPLSQYEFERCGSDIHVAEHPTLLSLIIIFILWFSVKPSIRISSDTIEIKEKGSFSVQCLADGEPKPSVSSCDEEFSSCLDELDEYYTFIFTGWMEYGWPRVEGGTLKLFRAANPLSIHRGCHGRWFW